VCLGQAENRLLQAVDGFGASVVLRYWHADRSNQIDRGVSLASRSREVYREERRNTNAESECSSFIQCAFCYI